MFTDVKSAADGIDAGLQAAGNPERGAYDLAYLKAPPGITSYGVGTPEMRRQLKAFLRARPDATIDDLIPIVEDLWARPVHSTRAYAVEMLDRRRPDLRPEHMDLVERMIGESFTWAYVDSLAANVAGSLVERCPALNRTLDRWSRDENFWVRRSSMLAMLHPLRHGRGDFDRFAHYADAMLEVREFFIRKAIGWVLREVSKKRPGLVRDFLSPRIGRVSGLTLREGAKYLPAPDREALLAAYRAR